jgi:hypothetical protein
MTKGSLLCSEVRQERGRWDDCGTDAPVRHRDLFHLDDSVRCVVPAGIAVGIVSQHDALPIQRSEPVAQDPGNDGSLAGEG